ncbi:MAG: hypothetical protein ACO3O3_08120 [Ilumatobacteraceae bacterium]
MMPDYRDLIERTVATFVQAAAGVALVNGLDWKAAAAAGIAAALAVLKAAARKRLAK